MYLLTVKKDSGSYEVDNISNGNHTKGNNRVSDFFDESQPVYLVVVE